jgi:hypothetical protein
MIQSAVMQMREKRARALGLMWVGRSPRAPEGRILWVWLHDRMSPSVATTSAEYTRSDSLGYVGPRDAVHYELSWRSPCARDRLCTAARSAWHTALAANTPKSSGSGRFYNGGRAERGNRPSGSLTHKNGTRHSNSLPMARRYCSSMGVPNLLVPIGIALSRPLYTLPESCHLARGRLRSVGLR